MSDPRAFVDACLGGPARPITDADIPRLTRTPKLRDQLARIADASAALDQIEVLRDQVTAILRREIAVFNAANIQEIGRQRGSTFDA